MMKGLRIAILAVSSPFVVGQMCGTTGPAPVQQDLGGGLRPGLYSGAMTTAVEFAIYGPDAPPPQQASETNDAFSITVSANGLPCNDKGQEYRIGLTDSLTYGPLVLQYTVTGVTVDEGKVSVVSAVSMAMSAPDGSNLTLTGFSTDLYSQLDDRTIKYDGRGSVATTLADVATASMTITGSSVVSR